VTAAVAAITAAPIASPVTAAVRGRSVSVVVIPASITAAIIGVSVPIDGRNVRGSGIRTVVVGISVSIRICGVTRRNANPDAKSNAGLRLRRRNQDNESSQYKGDESEFL
jgi:hypothetical protein